MLEYLALTYDVHRYMTGRDGEENVPHREWLIMYDRVVKDVKEELRRQGREDEFVGSRVRSITDAWYVVC